MALSPSFSRRRLYFRIPLALRSSEFVSGYYVLLAYRLQALLVGLRTLRMDMYMYPQHAPHADTRPPPASSWAGSLFLLPLPPFLPSHASFSSSPSKISRLNFLPTPLPLTFSHTLARFPLTYMCAFHLWVRGEDEKGVKILKLENYV